MLIDYLIQPHFYHGLHSMNLFDSIFILLISSQLSMNAMTHCVCDRKTLEPAKNWSRDHRTPNEPYTRSFLPLSFSELASLVEQLLEIIGGYKACCLATNSYMNAGICLKKFRWQRYDLPRGLLQDQIQGPICKVVIKTEITRNKVISGFSNQTQFCNFHYKISKIWLQVTSGPSKMGMSDAGVVINHSNFVNFRWQNLMTSE